MTEQAVVRRRDPLLDPPVKKGLFGLPTHILIILGVIIIGVHAAIIYALYKQRFELVIREYTDDTVDVELIDPLEEPPPPPPPPPPDQPPPPKLQPRPPQNVRTDLAPPPLDLPPVKEEDRVEYQGPPQITQQPPPPIAAPPPPRPAVITSVQWSRRPTLRADDYPDRALQREIEGSATLRCTAQSDGRPVNCQVVSEDPSGYGFGAAAVRVVQRGQLTPATVDGAAQNATFTVRIPFQLGD